MIVPRALLSALLAPLVMAAAASVPSASASSSASGVREREANRLRRQLKPAEEKAKKVKPDDPVEPDIAATTAATEATQAEASTAAAESTESDATTEEVFTVCHYIAREEKLKTFEGTKKELQALKVWGGSRDGSCDSICEDPEELADDAICVGYDDGVETCMPRCSDDVDEDGYSHCEYDKNCPRPIEEVVRDTVDDLVDKDKKKREKKDKKDKDKDEKGGAAETATGTKKICTKANGVFFTVYVDADHDLEENSHEGSCEGYCNDPGALGLLCDGGLRAECKPTGVKTEKKFKVWKCSYKTG